jgi:hypothetical protein
LESANKALIDLILTAEPNSQVTSVSVNSDVKRILQLERQYISFTTVGILVGLFAWLLVTDTLKRFVPCGGVYYWLLVFSIMPIVAVLMVVVRKHLVRKGNLKLEVCTSARSRSRNFVVLYPSAACKSMCEWFPHAVM